MQPWYCDPRVLTINRSSSKNWILHGIYICLCTLLLTLHYIKVLSLLVKWRCSWKWWVENIKLSQVLSQVLSSSLPPTSFWNTVFSTKSNKTRTSCDVCMLKIRPVCLMVIRNGPFGPLYPLSHHMRSLICVLFLVWTLCKEFAILITSDKCSVMGLEPIHWLTLYSSSLCTSVTGLLKQYSFHSYY